VDECKPLAMGKALKSPLVPLAQQAVLAALSAAPPGLVRLLANFAY